VSYLVIATLAAIAAITYRDYGISWDDPAHVAYGELLLRYYSSSLQDLRAFSLHNLFYYGGGFDLVAAAIAKHGELDIYQTRRLLGATLGICGLAIVWRSARRLGGPLAGLVALVGLASCPLYYGHMFINCKDTPFAVGVAFTLYSSLRLLEQYPYPNVSGLFRFGFALGVTVGTRVVGIATALFLVISLCVFFVEDWKHAGLRASLDRLASFSRRFASILPLAYAVMIALWPWAAFAPFNPLKALWYFSKFWERPWKELFDGTIISILEMPREYVPKLLLLTLPEGFLVLFLIGVGTFCGQLYTMGSVFSSFYCRQWQYLVGWVVIVFCEISSMCDGLTSCRSRP
jgi:hypothetical protein